ncbi:MAG: murein biosynthesis integral membrane protein MurJ [Minisyncoccales bacterium]
MSFFNHRAKNVTLAAFILMVTTLIAKLLSLARLRVFTTLFTTEELDIYFAAFRIPDLLYNVLILGAISTAFIPVFSDYWSKSKEEAWKLCNNVLCVFLGLLIILAILLAIFAPQLMHLVAPGFDDAKMNLLVRLTRIMFLSPIILGISNIFGSLLQYFSRFLIYSLAPIMYNVGIILGALFFAPKMGIEGLAWGVVLGAVFHLCVQLPAVFLSGYRFNAVFDFSHQGLRKIFKLMVPRTIGLAAQQINLIIMTAIASLLAVGSITIFNISNDLQYIPISLFGVSFATAVFPSLSRSFSRAKASLNKAKKEKEKFMQKFISVFSQILFFTLPLSILFFLLRAQLVRIIPGSENYTWQDTRLTAACLGIFAFSIFAQSLIPLITRAFYSFQDTKTPVKISVFSIILNIIFAFLFVYIFSFNNGLYYFFQSFLKLEGISQISIIGLPLAFSLSSVINLILLLSAFKKRVGDHWDLKLGNVFLRILFLSLLCGGVTFGCLHLFALFFDLQTFGRIFLQAVFAGGIGLIFYIYLSKILHFPEYDLIFEPFLARKKYGNKEKK